MVSCAARPDSAALLSPLSRAVLAACPGHLDAPRPTRARLGAAAGERQSGGHQAASHRREEVLDGTDGLKSALEPLRRAAAAAKRRRRSAVPAGAGQDLSRVRSQVHPPRRSADVSIRG
eukprot:scaffold2326_cov286-Pinguiococcus_pyrenoidosus.AAC.8